MLGGAGALPGAEEASPCPPGCWPLMAALPSPCSGGTQGSPPASPSMSALTGCRNPRDTWGCQGEGQLHPPALGCEAASWPAVTSSHAGILSCPGRMFSGTCISLVCHTQEVRRNLRSLSTDTHPPPFGLHCGCPVVWGGGVVSEKENFLQVSSRKQSTVSSDLTLPVPPELFSSLLV